MPGIVGIFSRAPLHGVETQIDVMSKCMIHEGFYNSRTFFNKQLRLAIGWVSQKGSFSDCLPVWNENEDVCLVFSGEDFSNESQIEVLRSKSHNFVAENASYIVHLYEEDGVDFLSKLNGWFSGVIIDLRQQKAILFNDRFGVNRIYYHENENGLYFASEAKSLLNVLPELRRMDPRSVGELISCGCVLQDRSLFSGISTLPCASAWDLLPGQRARRKVYFRKEVWEQQPVLRRSEFYDRLKDVWGRVLPHYFRGDAPVGLSLTGGVDSRMILAWAPRGRGELPCYTFGGKYRDCADVKISRRIAKVTRQKHETIRLNGEFLSGFPSLAEKTIYISDGAMDVRGAVDLYAQQLVRQIAPVRITGVYGGEILRRLVVFKPRLFQRDIFDPELAGLVAKAAETYAAELEGNQLSFTAFKQAPWYMTGKFSIERSQLTCRTPYFDNEIVALAYQTPAEFITSNSPSLQLVADRNQALSRIETDRGLLLKSLPGFGRAANIYQEFTFKAEYAYDYGMPQWLAAFDRVFAPLHLEKLFLGRHKVDHFRIWYQKELSQYIREILLDSRARNRNFIKGSRLEELVNDHLKGARNFTIELHKLLTLELIQRVFIDRN